MRAARRQRSNTGDAGDRAKAAFPSARRSPGKTERSQTVSSAALPRKGRTNTSARRTGSRRADASARGSPLSARCGTPPVAAWRAWAFAADRQASSLLADRVNARQDRRAPRMRIPARDTATMVIFSKLPHHILPIWSMQGRIQPCRKPKR